MLDAGTLPPWHLTENGNLVQSNITVHFRGLLVHIQTCRCLLVHESKDNQEQRDNIGPKFIPYVSIFRNKKRDNRVRGNAMLLSFTWINSLAKHI